MSLDEERRPAGNGAPSEAIRGHHSTDRSQRSAACRLRSRRAASWRCEPLEDGRHDPLDPLALVEPVSERALASWRAAWAHLARLGYAVDVPVAVAAAGERERRTCSCGAAS